MIMDSGLYVGKWRKHYLYSIWNNMLQRCENNKNPRYKDYGGRGIGVCERWRQSFPLFLLDMGDRPVGMSIDRRDNDGNYEPENCRWATPKEQGANKRNNIQSPPIFIQIQAKESERKMLKKIAGKHNRTSSEQIRFWIANAGKRIESAKQVSKKAK